MTIAIIGAGLAGCECAWMLAENYHQKVHLFEMKSTTMTPAQKSPHLFAELVCSNSLKSFSLLNPAGLLKKEMRLMNSLVLRAADASTVPAGESLSVDREKFSEIITQAIQSHPRIQVVPTLVQSIDSLLAQEIYSAVVVATGPLTHETLARSLQEKVGAETLYFYDAIAPIIDGSTVDKEIAFFANRKTRARKVDPTEEETADYLNIPFTKEEYLQFVEDLNAGDKVPFHNFEEPRYFNGCQPLEVLAASGVKTLAFGPLKPRGLTDPKTGREPYAAIQLRKEKNGDEMFNMVGCQTRLKWPEQKRIFQKIPALRNVEFFRLGSMHRNTYFVSPEIMNDDLSLKKDNRIFLAGQIMGVEGYLESAAMGMMVGWTLAQRLQKNSLSPAQKLNSPLHIQHPPAETGFGSLLRYLKETRPKDFSPMNIHWGLYEPPSQEDLLRAAVDMKCGQLPLKQILKDKSLRRYAMSKRGEHAFNEWIVKHSFFPVPKTNEEKLYLKPSNPTELQTTTA